MAEQGTFDVELIPPDNEGESWEARTAGMSSYGETAVEALINMGSLVDDIVETAEYYRVHAPGIYGHQTGRKVPESDNRDNLPVPKGGGSQRATAVHQTE